MPDVEKFAEAFEAQALSCFPLTSERTSFEKLEQYPVGGLDHGVFQQRRASGK
jgi:hypothetical protein